ncbi:MAG: hypothetical protein ACKVJC_05755, partial [Flavobacteriales bacterium]
MQLTRANSFVIVIALLYIALCGYFMWNDQAFLSLAPIGLLALFFAVYHTEYTFLSIAFLTPLSINIEEYTDSFGLFIPTEPLLFALLILLLLQQFKKNMLDKD